MLVLFNPDELRLQGFKHDAVRDIESKLHKYFVEVKQGIINTFLCLEEAVNI